MSPSTDQGSLRGRRGPPAVTSHPVRDRSVPASPPRATNIASCLTLRLWSCRDSEVKFAEPSLFRCPHCEGWAPSPLPGHLRGLAQTPAGSPVFGDMAGGAAAPPAPSAPGSSPPPAAAPAAACSSRALGQRQRQLPEPETMLLRHPHAVPSNALQREDGRREKGSEGAEGRAALLQRREGPGRRGLVQGPGGAAHRPPRDPSPASAAAIREAGAGLPGAGQSVADSTYPVPLRPSLSSAFLLSAPRRVWDTAQTPLERAGLWNVSKGHPPWSSPRVCTPRPGGTNIPPAKFGSSHIPKSTGDQAR